MSYFNDLLQEDDVWSAITGNLSGRRRTSGTNFINVNCPMCLSRGETADRRGRCGIKRDETGIGVYCFNCGFKTRHQAGQMLSGNMRQLMLGLGVSDIEVKRLNHKALALSRMIQKADNVAELFPHLWRPEFETRPLPAYSAPISQLLEEGCGDPDFVDALTYLAERGEALVTGAEFYWSPSEEYGMNRRVILPFKFEGRIVGYTARTIDDSSSARRKYHSSVPTNYLFNNHRLRDQSKYCIVVEGPFDAIACNGISTLGAKLSDEQAHWIKSSGKTVIVLPDRDRRGSSMIDMAVKNGWHVSFPRLKDGSGGARDNWWEPDVKDAAQAAQRYGKLYTIRSIVEMATADTRTITIKQKLLF